MKKLKKILIALSLTLVFLCAAFASGCGNGETAVKEDFAEAVNSLTTNDSVYASGNVELSRKENNSHEVYSNADVNVKGTFSGGLAYDSVTQNYKAFDFDLFSVTNITNVAQTKTQAGGYFVRDGKAYYLETPAHSDNDYDTLKADVLKALEKGENLTYDLDLKEALADGIGVTVDVPEDFEKARASAESLSAGLIKGFSELCVIEKNGSDYTFDFTKTVCELIDKIAAATEKYLKTPNATVGEFYATAEAQAILSPVLKNVKAKDLVDVVSALAEDGTLTETTDGKLNLNLDGMIITLDKPSEKATLDEYLVKTVFETKIDTGMAKVAIKDVTLNGFLGGATTEQPVSYTDEQIAEILNGFKEAKQNAEEEFPTAKITLTIKKGKVTHIKVDIKRVEYTYLYEMGSNKKTKVPVEEWVIKIDADVLDKMPALTDVSKNIK